MEVRLFPTMGHKAAPRLESEGVENVSGQCCGGVKAVTNCG